jgi:hypothetical protein
MATRGSGKKTALFNSCGDQIGRHKQKFNQLFEKGGGGYYVN